jgi:thiol-disulfide isomerase/thioredoxin
VDGRRRGEEGGEPDAGARERGAQLAAGRGGFSHPERTVAGRQARVKASRAVAPGAEFSAAARSGRMASMRLAAPLLALAVVLPAAADEEIAVGLPAPTFSLRAMNPDAAGAQWVSLDALVGAEPTDPDARLVLLSFFASWCEPCRRELPFLVELDRAYRARGLRVLSVAIDREEPAIEAARRMAAAAGVTWPVLSDRFNFLARRYLGEQAPLPSVFLVRRDGTLARIERGYAKDASKLLLAEVRAALGAAAEPAGGTTLVPAAAPGR